jgi:hypothetical protein
LTSVVGLEGAVLRDVQYLDRVSHIRALLHMQEVNEHLERVVPFP